MGSREKKKNIIEENDDTDDIQICTTKRCKSDDATNTIECGECI